MAYFGKEFTFQKEENYEAYVRSFGLPEADAKEFMAFKPNNKIEKHGDTYKLVFILPSGNKEHTFKNGVEADEVIAEGLMAKTTITVDGDTFTQVQKVDDGHDTVVTYKWEYTANSLKVTATKNGWDGEAVRWYTAV